MPDSLNVQFDDSLLNWRPKTPTGYSDEMSRGDTVETYAAAGFIDFPDELYIDPKDWEDAARDNDKYGNWAEDRCNRFTNQSPTHECTTHCFIQCAETTWNMQRGSMDSQVWFSPLSLYAEANPRQWGGAMVREIVRIAMRRGVLPEHNGPAGPGTQKRIFQHTLNCSSGNSRRDGGPWVSLRNFPRGWENTSQHFRPEKVINVKNWQQHFMLLLRGYAVGNGRDWHSIPHVRAVKRNGVWYSKARDSYDRSIYDSVNQVRKGVDSAYAIASMKRPDDWKKPAGDDMRVLA